MFCPECGKSNQEGLANCVYCGALLIDNQPEIKNTQFSQFFKKHMKLLIAVACLIVVVISFFITGSALSNPDRVVNKYVDSLISSDLKTAYGLLDLEESDFINYDLFAAFQEKSDLSYSEIKNYSVHGNDMYFGSSGYSDGYSSLIKKYVVSYVISGSSSERNFTVSLIEQDKKTLLFFPTYKVSTEEYVCDYTILAKDGVTVSVDGINVTATNGADENGMVTYYIPSVFIGKHTLVASHPLCEDYETEIYAQTNNNRTYVDSLNIKNEVITALASQTEENLKKLCGGALAKADFDSIDINLTSDENSVSKIREFYSQLMSDFKKEDGTGFKSITFTSFTDDSYQAYLNEDLSYKCNLSYTYDYVSLYKTKNTLAERASSYSRNGSIEIIYTYEENAWVISSVNIYRLYY